MIKSFDKTSFKTLFQPHLDNLWSDLSHNSRVHSLRSIPAWVKREDELSFATSGYKLRKYFSLLPYIEQQQYNEVVLIGTALSNHILSFSQLLIEKGIRPVLFLKTPQPSLKREEGNFLFTSLFIPSEDIHWIPVEDWDYREQIVQTYVQRREKEGVKTFSVPLGAAMKEALPGCLTLALDILRNEEELALEFDHIFIDSGTGVMAAILMLVYAYLQKKTQIHVFLIGGTTETFFHTLSKSQKWFSDLLSAAVPSPTLFTLNSPLLPFGIINEEILQFIVKFGKMEGILLDPIYNGKLFFEGKKSLSSLKKVHNPLFIHSGGGFAFTGFQRELAEVLKKQESNKGAP
jgi:1-aminocyclopropane-1-carboxylate deaminase